MPDRHEFHDLRYLRYIMTSINYVFCLNGFDWETFSSRNYILQVVVFLCFCLKKSKLCEDYIIHRKSVIYFFTACAHFLSLTALVALLVTFHLVTFSTNTRHWFQDPELALLSLAWRMLTMQTSHGGKDWGAQTQGKEKKRSEMILKDTERLGWSQKWEGKVDWLIHSFIHSFIQLMRWTTCMTTFHLKRCIWVAQWMKWSSCKSNKAPFHLCIMF